MEEVMTTQNKGKRKIPIETITNKTKKQVTFSKRRGGLNKKGSELCCLCDANIAIITFSGAGKLFCFGHPSVEDVVQRYIGNNNTHSTRNNANSFSDNRDNNSRVGQIDSLAKHYKGILGQIEVEKRASSSNNNVNNSNNNWSYYYGNNINGRFWLDDNIDEMGLVELERYKVALESLRNQVAIRVDEINRSSMGLVPQNFDLSTRDGNTIAHCQGYDGADTRWVDYGTSQDKLFQPALSMDTFHNMFMKREA
ncbi:hypothetical protein vseg_009794 [Gypsophila vaccaria]